ncbi:MAG: hypothetical protein HYU76_12160 [Betaproteobacteria bacterium]|nr:hypothetical protein [Betaproteobacteria bacterium]
MNPGPAVRAYWWFKAAIFALLAWNSAVFVATGTLSEALDATAWLVLLVLFELETGFGDRFRGGGAAVAIHGTRLAAAAAVGAAAIGYVYENEWLDAVNSVLWIAVVALLEIEVRHPGAVERHRARFATVAATLYAGLGALALVWWWQGEWFDAYDAALWLIALVTIEIIVLRISRPGVYAEAGAPEPR